MIDLSTKARLAVADQYKANNETALAVKVIYEGLNVDPDNVELLRYLATLHMVSKNYGLVYTLLKRAKEIDPSDATLDHNIGLAVMNMAPISNREEFLDDAEKRLKKALQKHPFWQSYSGLAQIALSRGEWDSCISHAKKALELCDKSDTTINQTLGFAYLAKGLFAPGWDEIEKHIGGEMRKPKAFGKEPYWDGSTRADTDVAATSEFSIVGINGLSMERKTRLFVQGEQGLGDEISFASVIPDASKEVDITLECDPRLEGLFKRSLPGIEIHGTRTSVREPVKRDWEHGPFDAMCLSGTLSRYYRRKVEDFPRKAFLTADPERRLQWRALLDSLPGKKVGIAWNGGIPMNFKGRRSVKLESLKYLLKTPGITWVSLEYKDASDEIEQFKARHGAEVKHWPRASQAEDYDETAALVSELDCVVSVCTAVVHLCGALGKTCHVLVPKVPRWFYGIEGRDHAWYESLILHRQKKEWPLDEVKAELLSNLFPEAKAAD